MLLLQKLSLYRTFLTNSYTVLLPFPETCMKTAKSWLEHVIGPEQIESENQRINQLS